MQARGVRRSRGKTNPNFAVDKGKPRQTLIQPGFSYQLFIRGFAGESCASIAIEKDVSISVSE